MNVVGVLYKEQLMIKGKKETSPLGSLETTVRLKDKSPNIEHWT